MAYSSEIYDRAGKNNSKEYELHEKLSAANRYEVAIRIDGISAIECGFSSRIFSFRT